MKNIDMSSKDFLVTGYKFINWINDYLTNLERLPVLPNVQPGDIKRSLPSLPPENPESFDEIFADLDNVIMPGVTHWNHPKFMAYFNSTSSSAGIFAELLSGAFNTNGMVWKSNPASTELEEVTLDWLRQMIGLPKEFWGIMYDLASSSTMHAIIAARENIDGYSIREKGFGGLKEMPRLRLYASEQAHSSIDKGAIFAGIGLEGIRKIPVDDNFRMIPSELKKAIKEAKYFGKVNVAASSEDKLFSYIPKNYNLTPDAAYVHTTSNNTIYGTEMWDFPETGSVPHICDMSSDFLSHPMDFSKFSMIYAGAQKNIGPSGTVAIIIKKSFADTARLDIPTMVNYRTHIEKDSLFNTPASLPVFIVGLVMEWILEKGGLEGIAALNKKKADLLYGTMENSNGFYKPHVTDVASRSFMNVTFKLPAEELEKKFIAEAAEKGLLGLKGHRSVGGCRASTYNAVSYKSVSALVDFMNDFKAKN